MLLVRQYYILLLRMSVWLIIVYCYHSVVWEFQNVCFLLTSVALNSFNVERLVACENIRFSSLLNGCFRRLHGSACLTIFEMVTYCVLTVLVTWYLLYLFHNNVVWFAFGVSGLLLSSCPKDIPHLFCHRMLRLHMRVSNTHHSRFRQLRNLLSFIL